MRAFSLSALILGLAAALLVAAAWRWHEAGAALPDRIASVDTPSAVLLVQAWDCPDRQAAMVAWLRGVRSGDPGGALPVLLGVWTTNPASSTRPGRAPPARPQERVADGSRGPALGHSRHARAHPSGRRWAGPSHGHFRHQRSRPQVGACGHTAPDDPPPLGIGRNPPTRRKVRPMEQLPLLLNLAVATVWLGVFVDLIRRPPNLPSGWNKALRRTLWGLASVLALLSGGWGAQLWQSTTTASPRNPDAGQPVAASSSMVRTPFAIVERTVSLDGEGRTIQNRRTTTLQIPLACWPSWRARVGCSGGGARPPPPSLRSSPRCS
jgi:hypothetical protein